MDWITIKQKTHKDKLEIIKQEMKETKDETVIKFLRLLKKRNEEEIERYESWR
ncbi:hypothetical protein ACTT1L_16695 [Bacillus sp. FH]|uniref:hypothetical protein n=1 Tax=Bacillus sp. FH TaxID=3456953 RepID=UPI003FA497EB|nr:hypothetical protein [Bacillus cereus]